MVNAGKLHNGRFFMANEYQYNLWHPDRLRVWMILVPVIFADFFLFRSPDPGSIPLTALYLGWLAVCWPRRLSFLSMTARILWMILFFLCGAGIFCYADSFAVVFACFSILVFRIVCREEKADSSVEQWILKLTAVCITFLPESFYQIAVGWKKQEELKSRFTCFVKGVLLWILPVLGALIFLGFFSEANPVLGNWLERFAHWVGTLDFPSAGHVFFWLVTALLAVAVTGMTLWKRFYAEFRNNTPGFGWKELTPDLSLLLARIMTRGLLLFNLVFLVQNLLDVEYLWAGAALPEGVTYAGYAHRGAYPLIATALIAGGLTLLAFSGKCSGSAWKLARVLVYFWLGQNVFLVASSLLRLEKYVSVYSLTGLRIAAAVWMLVVGAGLCLIFCKVLRNKSLRWLFWANGAQVLIVLLLVMFFDFRYVIAEYNFTHCRETVNVTKEGLRPAPLDVEYLKTLLPSSLPVLIRVQKAGIGIPDRFDPQQEMKHLERLAGNWRSWTPLSAVILRAAEAELGEKSR